MTSVFDRRLIVLAGKGGVGRTTVACALAVAAARRGKRVLLCQTKAKERLSTLFGVRPVGPEIVQVKERLYAVNMRPDVALREYGTMVLHSAFVARQVLDNRVSRAFLHAVPGLDDYSMLGKVWYHTTEEEHGRPKWDLVILDGPATGHIVTMLRIPLAILESVPDGPLTRAAKQTADLLRDPARTQMVLVTLAEEMPAIETVELAEASTKLIGVAHGPLVVNRVYPPRFRDLKGRAALQRFTKTGDATLDAMIARGKTGAERRAVNERYLELLRAELPLPQIQLPYLFSTEFGPQAIETLATHFETQAVARAVA